MGVELTIRGGLIGLLILIWILGKALWSIPFLYKESKYKKGSEAYGDLSILLGFRVMGILFFLGVLSWGMSKLGYQLDAVEDITFSVFVALFAAGIGAFFVLMITLILGKLNRFQRGVEENEVLDDLINRDL